MTIRIKDWSKFQHFKDRRPPWVKLYRDLLDDMEWHELDPAAAKALVMLWLIASEYDGDLPDIRKLAFRLRMDEPSCKSLICQLSHWLEDDDNAAISERYQGDGLEGETEVETETEGEPRPKRQKRKAETTLPEWTEALDGADAIPADDPLFAWAAKVGIPHDWLALAWWVFEARYADNPKRYADWRAVFRKAVREDWLKLGRTDQRAGGFVLTAAGEMAQREMAP